MRASVRLRSQHLVAPQLGSQSRAELEDNSLALSDPPTVFACECCCQTKVAMHGQSQNEILNCVLQCSQCFLYHRQKVELHNVSWFMLYCFTW